MREEVALKINLPESRVQVKTENIFKIPCLEKKKFQSVETVNSAMIINDIHKPVLFYTYLFLNPPVKCPARF